VGALPGAATPPTEENAESVNGDQLVQMGLDGLERLVTEHGFNASDAESGLYPALYGRDSLWVLILLQHAAGLRADARIQTLLDETGPRVLMSLAALQGAVVNDLVEEQPGRIPHEYHPVPTDHALRAGLPLADGCSFGGFDETFLFVLAYDAFVGAHPGHPVADALRPNIERALTWIDDHSDPDGDGLFEYLRRNPANLLNQVWKDSFDSATHTGFDVPPQPLAWLEVQAYAYAVFGTPGAGAAAGRSSPRDQHRAGRIAELVDQHYWLGPDDGFAMALDGRKQPLRMVASNAAHALWAGLVLPSRVDQLVERMTRSDLLSAYGLRTLSRESPYYAPFAYHRGAVWPFDNAVFALGLLRHGRLDLARRVAAAVGQAVSTAGTPVECYVVVEPEDLMEQGGDRALLCWRQWPVQNKVQAFTAAALVVFGLILGGAE
jgi:glycogen debranching enzyme